MEIPHKANLELATRVLNTLQNAGFDAYFAGGCVRDLVMNREPEDYDIATSAKPDEIEKLFARTIPVGKQFGVIIVVADHYHFEVATFRSDVNYHDGRRPESVRFVSAGEDAGRRDFTINGLFFDPVKSCVVDYVNGRADIERQIVRTIGKPEDRFREDHLRILRAIRFAANLDFQIEESTWKAVCENRKLIHKVSPERVREELVKMFTRARAGKGLELLSKSGILAEILPEVEAMRNVRQPPQFHPEGDVFQHTMLMMNSLRAPSAVLAFSALLHDVGKPQTFSTKEGAIHFYNHAPVGAAIAREILTRLKFSNNEIEDICYSIENHMRFGDVQEMRIGKLKQLIAAKTFPEELELHRVDCMASHMSLDNYHFLGAKKNEFEKEGLKPKPLVNGYDLMALGVKAGPKMKEILSDVYMLQLESKFEDKQDALNYILQKYVKGEADL